MIVKENDYCYILVCIAYKDISLPGSTLNKDIFYRSAIVAFLVCIAVYFFFFSLPILLDLHIIGFEGKIRDGAFQITRVHQGSPAATAGIGVGDVLLEQDGIPVEEWSGIFSHDLGSYLLKRSSWQISSIDHSILRNNSQSHIMIQPRTLSPGELLWLYFIRFTLSAILAALALFIVFSNKGSRDAYLCSLSFSFIVLWLLCGEKYWRGFMYPYFPSITTFKYLVIEPVFMFSNCLMLSALLHFSLIFPEEREFYKKNRWLLAPVYLTAPVIISLSIYFSSGSISERYTAAYNPRLAVFSAYLALSLILLLGSYFTCRSPLQKERSRLVVISAAIAIGSYLFLWNIPKLIFGRTFFSNFDWLLFPLLLVPVAMTVAIDRHYLFGIRGIAKRRIRILEEFLQKERESGASSKQKIEELSGEIRQLQTELDRYVRIELPTGETERTDEELFGKLVQKHPGIRTVREERLISRSPLWKKVFEETIIASQGDAPVLIEGESGTGKSDVAWAICFLSEKKDRVYKEISCAQFEHSDPAFALGKIFGIGRGHGLPNVAKEGQRGLLEECDGGTLFLDDSDRLPLNVQDLLLYPLEGKTYEPGIGSGPAKKVSVKFIFATNRNLKQLAEEGRFRSDVLARIVNIVHVPPLRERAEDIPLLIEHFTAMAARELKHDISSISPKAMNLLLNYDYAAGNVRELKSEIYKAIGKAMLEGDHVLRAGYFSEQLSASGRARSFTDEDARIPGPAGSMPTGFNESKEIEILRKHQFRIRPSEKELDYSHKSRTLSNHFRGICIKTLSENEWDVERAARRLAGGDDPRLIEKVKGKLIRFFTNVEENVTEGTEKKLFNNLPAQYHPAFHAAISHIRSKSPSEIK